MKAIILITIVFFSFTNVNAQKTSSDGENNKEVTTEFTTKADFYNALIKANKFDIKIKKTKIAKSGYYNRLLIKNGFRLRTRKSTRLSHNNTKGISLLHNTAS